jgi:hypothetical protein
MQWPLGGVTGITLAVSVVPLPPNEVNFSRRNHEEHHCGSGNDWLRFLLDGLDAS